MTTDAKQHHTHRTVHPPPRQLTCAEFLTDRYVDLLHEARLTGSARVTAQAAVNFRLVGLHGGWHPCADTAGHVQPHGPDMPCPTLLTLTIPYASHPDFDPAWHDWTPL